MKSVGNEWRLAICNSNMPRTKVRHVVNGSFCQFTDFLKILNAIAVLLMSFEVHMNSFS